MTTTQLMTPTQESQRVTTLRNYRILDTISETEFDAITKMAAYICNAPISLITLIDRERQWFKSAIGVGDLKETPRDISFCTHTIAETADFLIVNDLTQDNRFVNNPFVQGEPFVKFYAGISLVNPDGHKLGTVCVFDQKSRQLDGEQLAALKTMANHVISLLEARKKNRELSAVNVAQKNIIQQLEQFSYVVAHDIKAPLRTMSSFSGLLSKKAKLKLDSEELDYLNFILTGAKELSTYTQNLLTFAKESNLNLHNATEINLEAFLINLCALLNKEEEIDVIYSEDLPTIFTSKVGLRQILQNLISNSIKYRNPSISTPYIRIDFKQDDDFYYFSIKDNGLGMTKVQLSNVFKLFHRNETEEHSTGIGLNIVKRLVEKLNGSISIDSTPNLGTTVRFKLEKIFKG